MQAYVQTEVIFIPKAGNGHSQTKEHRPIILSSFLLKGLKKTILWWLQVWGFYLLGAQHAYRAGESCDTALWDTYRELERGQKNFKGFAIAVGLYASGAFDNLSFNAMAEAMTMAQFPTSVREWNTSLLKGQALHLGDIFGSPINGTLSKSQKSHTTSLPLVAW